MSKTIFTRSFNALLATQFLGACNDNVLKQLIALQIVGGVWASRLGEGGQGIVTLLFTLPFLLFSGWAGQIADRISKQRLTVWVKIAEIFLALVTLLALSIQSLTLAIVALTLLALQSTVFGPAKYGLIPELIPVNDLGKANGALNLFSNISIILGAVIAGFLSDAYPAERILPGAVILLIAAGGYAASRFIVPLPAHDPSIRLSRFPLTPYFKSLALMYRRRQLIVIALGWAFFWMIGVMVLQAVLDFKLLLNLTDRDTSLLNVPIIIGIGVGSALAGALSRKRIRVDLVPIGAAGIVLMLALIGLSSLSYRLLAAYLVGLGIFGGFYIVPLQSLIQARSPAKLRGRILGTTNFLSFTFIASGGGLYWVLRNAFGMTVQPMLVLCSGLTLLCSIYVTWRVWGLLMERETVAVEQNES